MAGERAVAEAVTRPLIAAEYASCLPTILM